MARRQARYWWSVKGYDTTRQAATLAVAAAAPAASAGCIQESKRASTNAAL